MKQFDYTTSQVWLRDGLVPFSEANLSLASSPFLYGLSIYTVCMAHWDDTQQRYQVFRLKDHYQRLIDSAKIMDFDSFVSSWSYAKFEAMIEELLLASKAEEDVLVRVSVFVDELLAGTRMHGLTTSLSAFVYPNSGLLPKDGAHVCISSWQRTPDNAIPSRAKINGSYVNACLMKNEALKNGYDEAIALDEHGHVSEGSVTNIFLVRGGKLVTPHGATDLLEGITRDTILKLANNLGIEHEERAVDRSELYIADEVFMCGSSAGIIPVLSVDKRQLTSSRSVTPRLQEAFVAARTGAIPAFAAWVGNVPIA
jgi:branched-chain amino acid aminotransferase